MKPIFFLLITTLLISTACKQDGNGPDVSEENSELTGRRLRDIMDEKFPDKTMIVGVTCGLWAFDYACGDIVDTEFNYITPENDFKQKIIHPNNTDWNPNDANEWIAHAEANN